MSFEKKLSKKYTAMRPTYKQTKNFLLFLSGTFLLFVITLPQMSCTDIEGDGADSLLWLGATLPEESSYRNPIWEPDLSNPSVFRGATQFFAFGDEKEWSEGLNYVVPVLRSGNLMTWSLSGEAFATRPSWAEGKISSVSGLFAKTLSTYYLAYTIDDEIGIAYSKAPQGPYIDYGQLVAPGDLDFDFCKAPYLIQAGLKFYLFFETEDGVSGTELNITRNAIPSLKGEVFKIAGSGFTGAHILRKSASSYYFFGTSGEEGNINIKIARSTNIDGPYLDKNGNDILSGNGTELISSDPAKNINSPSQVGGIFTDFEEKDWIIYQVTDNDKPNLSTGTPRRPLMLNRIEWDEEGWPVTIIEAAEGWQKPKFVLSN